MLAMDLRVVDMIVWFLCFVPCRWLCGDVIGEGAFGTVHMGLNLDTGELMAVKSISLDQGDITSADAKAFENEIAILRDNK